MTKDEEERVLDYEMRPDLPGYAKIFDRFVNAAEPRHCFVCAGPIERGERIRARFEVREIRTPAHRMFYACGACCGSMLLAVDPTNAAGQAAMAERLEMGQARPTLAAGAAP